eukprot:COSAG02_NODE_6707_length_3408_cov_34.569961_1_plen_227_part_10
MEGRKFAYAGAQSLGSLSDSAAQETQIEWLDSAKNDPRGHKAIRTLEPVAIWCGNIPETSSSEAAIRVLFSPFGQIRRIILRRKPSPGMSWCLITYRSSASVKAALATPVMAKGPDGKDVRIAVELPEIEKELMSCKADSLDSQSSFDSQNLSTRDGQGEPTNPEPGSTSKLSEASQATGGLPTPTGTRRRKRRTLSMPARRLSVVELDVRTSLSPTLEEGKSIESC